MQLTFTIADTHIHCIQCDEREGDNGKSLLVFAADLKTGQTHTTRWTEAEASLVYAVACVGEERDLPAKMYREAEELVKGFPNNCRPIP